MIVVVTTHGSKIKISSVIEYLSRFLLSIRQTRNPWKKLPPFSTPESKSGIIQQSLHGLIYPIGYARIQIAEFILFYQTASNICI
jgi:hypothetical protein